MPPEIWVTLDRDADRCGRSATKQMEVIFRAYYGLGNASLDEAALIAARQSLSQPIYSASPQGLGRDGETKRRRTYLNSTGRSSRNAKGTQKKSGKPPKA